MNSAPVFKRVLIKLSGEALMGPLEYGTDPKTVGSIADQLKTVHDRGVQIAVVLGAGNIYRGLSQAAEGMDRATADYMGMLAIVLNALTLQESTYPAVQYVPLADVDSSLLERTDTTTYCPYKGDASYYSITSGGDQAVDAVWEYQQPRDAVAAVKDHVAFYPDRVDGIEIEA